MEVTNQRHCVADELCSSNTRSCLYEGLNRNLSSKELVEIIDISSMMLSSKFSMNLDCNAKRKAGSSHFTMLSSKFSMNFGLQRGCMA